MAEEPRTERQELVPANDNGDPDRLLELTPAVKLDRVVLDIARLIGRQMARETFEAGLAANDNRPGRREGEGRGPDEKPLGNKREDPPP